MKKWAIVFGLSIAFAQSAMASQRVALVSELQGSLPGVYVTSSEWNTSGKGFDEVDSMGIVFDAVQEGLRQCRSAGFDLCVVKSISLDKARDLVDGRRHTKFTTVLKAIDDVPGLQKDQVFSTSSSVSKAGNISGLGNLGASGSALNSALSQCYAAGNEFCTVLNVSYKEVNAVRPDGRHQTTAEASVRGYSLK